MNEDYKAGFNDGCNETIFGVAEIISTQWTEFIDFCICCGDEYEDDYAFGDRLVDWFREKVL